MLTQIEGYFRAGQPTRYLPRPLWGGVAAADRGKDERADH